MVDFSAELTAWLRSTDVRTLMKEIVAEAVQTEIRSALEDELIDIERAAAMLDMTPGALRKAVERGQVPCQRIGAPPLPADGPHLAGIAAFGGRAGDQAGGASARGARACGRPPDLQVGIVITGVARA